MSKAWPRVVLSPILFSVFVNDLLKEVEQTGLGIQLSSGKTVGGMLFADDFVGISDSKESLQKLLDVVYSYCSKWRLRANVSKSAVMVFSKDSVNGCWKWGEYSLPIVSSYTVEPPIAGPPKSGQPPDSGQPRCPRMTSIHC